ncbi:MAG: hypothetical protein RLZZ616_1880 [Pseudomonadota bacterium]|jgi:hypothetical protein
MARFSYREKRMVTKQQMTRVPWSAGDKKPGFEPGWRDKLLIQVFVKASSVDVV